MFGYTTTVLNLFASPTKISYIYIYEPWKERQRQNKKKKQSYWWQDLRLGDDAVGKAVLPALGGHLRPGDLEPRDPLVGRHPGHSPQEAAGDVALTHGEGGRQVLRLGQNLRVQRSCAEGGEESRWDQVGPG